MIPRKWEWIKDQCIRRGFKEAAKLAGEIDTVLLECYDKKHTREWKVFYESNKMDEIATRTVFFYVVKAIKFCVACQVCKSFCWGCSFAKKCGKCIDHDSLYGRFFEAAKGSRFKGDSTDKKGGINRK